MEKPVNTNFLLKKFKSCFVYIVKVYLTGFSNLHRLSFFAYNMITYSDHLKKSNGNPLSSVT